MSDCPLLIVEDEVLIALQVQKYLSRLGFSSCKLLVTGEDAIQVIRDEPVCAVFMDIRLAGKLSGLDAARAIRAFSDVPLIFISGYLEDALRKQVQELQHSRYLVKPIFLNDIQVALNEVLEEEVCPG